jgi:hypothetical protein
VWRYLQGNNGLKPNCFAIKDNGSRDVVAWIKSGDQFASAPENQPHLISVTDWLS